MELSRSDQNKYSGRSWTNATFITLNCAYARPHLKYASVVWLPYTIKESNILEKVQRRATKLVQRIRSFGYSDRFSILRLPTMSKCRSRGDMIQMFKIRSGLNSIDWVRSAP
ncbi:RNA-directed DNA polymerase from mobile element jockey-like [Brachionus plicatilis]|uniref:RNA-directed DNA polymerase from mobile element jockey-like n=1 Tax=Brachionus plicatilis TaxID=10195 RepID=A0A3M7RJ18_BRAPC|nr:RNA-directed DNA polymerase from mobile element jockey-like [Brachionus plicatilis]